MGTIYVLVKWSEGSGIDSIVGWSDDKEHLESIAAQKNAEHAEALRKRRREWARRLYKAGPDLERELKWADEPDAR
jgi:hypothetical protein